MLRGEGSKGKIICLQRTSAEVMHNIWSPDSTSIHNNVHPLWICVYMKFTVNVNRMLDTWLNWLNNSGELHPLLYCLIYLRLFRIEIITRNYTELLSAISSFFFFQLVWNPRESSLPGNSFTCNPGAVDCISNCFLASTGNRCSWS